MPIHTIAPTDRVLARTQTVKVATRSLCRADGLIRVQQPLYIFLDFHLYGPASMEGKRVEHAPGRLKARADGRTCLPLAARLSLCEVPHKTEQQCKGG